jgi:hypothetical protein
MAKYSGAGIRICTCGWPNPGENKDCGKPAVYHFRSTDERAAPMEFDACEDCAEKSKALRMASSADEEPHYAITRIADTPYLVWLEYSEPALEGPFENDAALLAKAREIRDNPDTSEDFVCFKLTVNAHGAPGVEVITDAAIDGEEEYDNGACLECSGWGNKREPCGACGRGSDPQMDDFITTRANTRACPYGFAPADPACDFPDCKYHGDA